MTTVALDTGVGPLLRSWRERSRISQLELALRADSSARHISFIETGRARPSEEMVLRLAEHLDVPVRERNALLVVAGYAPRYTETALDDPAMGALREGMDRLLQGYDPYPALVVDGMYNVVAANQGIARMTAGVAEHLLAPPLNAMRLTLHPEGLAPGSTICASGGPICWRRWSVRSPWSVRRSCVSCTRRSRAIRWSRRRAVGSGTGPRRRCRSRCRC